MAYLPEAKSEALRALPQAALLIDVFSDRTGTFLVGGAVRDLMLGFIQFDFDLMVEHDAAGAAAAIAERVPGKVLEYPQFLTANFSADDGSLNVDIATARTETYERPGAMPKVTAATPEEDLARRDFTVNAMALAIWADRFGELHEYADASSDLMARLLRVTHDASFIDDPTRLLRLLRYGARLGFTAEPHTEELARQAVAAGAMKTISGGRIRDELIDLLAERSAVVALESMYSLGLDRAIHPKLDADEYVASRAMLELPESANQSLTLLAACSRELDSDELRTWLQELALPRADAAVVKEAVARSAGLLAELDAAEDERARLALLSELQPETLTLALALPGSARSPHADLLRAQLRQVAAAAA